MKQNKTTLIFGILLAVLVTVLIVVQINNTPLKKESEAIENASITPIVKKGLLMIKRIGSL